MNFWERFETLITEHEIVIDRPKGTRHPKYPQIVYPLDYGYLKGTTAGDGGGIDVWIGSMDERKITGIVITVDTLKKDSEVKILIGCNEDDKKKILKIVNNPYMSGIIIDNPISK
ncbi:inorganic pyrophosphatase [Kosmotoga sp. DU53]|uniref:inorganic pyrophosphatase n=1 Tax=Kosmotoga sp. DU53 TaxID=1310160 RepID=UPI0009EF3226|nr:inorganic pyrophosphatase [Kosmotoga sp. DU53]